MTKQENSPDFPLWDATMDMIGSLPGVHICSLELKVDPSETQYTPMAEIHWSDRDRLADLKVQYIELTAPRPLGTPLPDIAHHIIASMGRPREKELPEGLRSIWEVIDEGPSLTSRPVLRQALLQACLRRAKAVFYTQSDDSLTSYEAYIDERGNYACREVREGRRFQIYSPEWSTHLMPELGELAIRLACILERETLPMHPFFKEAIEDRDVFGMPETKHPNHVRYFGYSI